jgi:hypothetical protein
MLPRWATEANRDADERDLERVRGLSPDERLAELVEVWELMESILRGRPDREDELARAEPLPEGWLAVLDRSRRGPEAG